jgi:hypothetical protein
MAKEIPTPYSGPTLAAIRKSLAELVTGGLVAYNVAEKGGALLRLELVRERLQAPTGADADSEDARDAAYAQALVAVLKDAVEGDGRILFRKHRRLLRYVLPLKEEYAKKSIKDRRTAAGKDAADGKPVKAGTIRTYYEPRALDELARVLVEMEAEKRGEVQVDDRNLA